MSIRDIEVLDWDKNFWKYGKYTYNYRRYLITIGVDNKNLIYVCCSDDVGKAYDIPVTGTLFTSITSQKVAARAGFDDYKAQAYDDVVDDNGVVSFPLLKGKLAKMMVKRLL